MRINTLITCSALQPARLPGCLHFCYIGGWTFEYMLRQTFLCSDSFSFIFIFKYLFWRLLFFSLQRIWIGIHLNGNFLFSIFTKRKVSYLCYANCLENILLHINTQCLCGVMLSIWKETFFACNFTFTPKPFRLAHHNATTTTAKDVRCYPRSLYEYDVSIPLSFSPTVRLVSCMLCKKREMKKFLWNMLNI